MSRLYILFVLVFSVFGCDEAPLIQGNFDQTLNAPTSFSLFPSSTLGLISNTNINLQEESGSIVAFDTATQSLLENTRFSTANFGVRPLIDDVNMRILVPDQDEALRIFNYSIPGTSGLAVSFSEEVITPALSDEITNGIEMDETPSDVLKVTTVNHGDLYIVANQMGTLTIVDVDTLEVMDLNVEDRFEGLRLKSALNIELEDTIYPARGVSKLFEDPVTKLIYATNPSSNFVYIFDAENLENEGMISFLDIGGNTTGIRSVTFDGMGKAYFLHEGLQSVLTVDVTAITDNGISFEVIDPVIENITPLFGIPNDLVINNVGDKAYVSLQDLNQVVELDLGVMAISNQVTLSKGRGPSKLYLNNAASTLLTVDFFSNTLSNIDVGTLTETGVIQ